ncbi:MAG: diguanylate cyclase [Polyangiaceae bacterium]
MPVILVVEDNPITRKLVRVSLRSADMDVVEATTGAEALDAARAHRANLILQDLALADMDGFELLGKLKLQSGAALPPVIAFTGLADRQRVLAAGFADLLLKPIDPARLVAYVRERLDGTSNGNKASAALRLTQVRASGTSAPDALLRSPLWSSVSKLFSNLADLTGGAAEFHDVLRTALASFLDASGFQCGAAYLPTPAGPLELRDQLGFHGAPLERLPQFAGRRALLDRVMRTAEPLVIDSEVLPDDASLLADLDARSLLLVPILYGRAPSAVFVMASGNRGMAPAWLDVARLMAAPIGQSLALAASVGRLAASEHRFRGIAESTRDGIVVANAGNVVTYVNAAASRVLAREASSLMGQPISELVPFVAQGVFAGSVRLPGGRDVPLEVSQQAFEDPPGHVNHVYVLRDLSERLRLEELAWLATHDPLTGLVNRRRFEEELSARLAESERYGTGGALLALDLDEFKPVNDTHGHAAGDLVLRAVAELLKSVTRSTDLAARIGGDEFAVLLNHTNAFGAETCARKLVERISEHVINYEGKSLRVGASVGVALLPEDGSTQQQLFAAADRALYMSKQAGRRRVSFSHRPDVVRESLAPDSRLLRERVGIVTAPLSERRR